MARPPPFRYYIWTLDDEAATISPVSERVPTVVQGKRRSVDLTPDLESAIQQRVESGAYQSDVDVIRAGLRALDRDDEEKARQLAKLDNSIARGIAAANAGRVHPAEKVFGELRKKVRHKAEPRS